MTKRGHKAIIRWADATPNGSPVTRYRVDISKGRDKSVPATSHRAVFKRLKPGRYRVRVAAKNAIGIGAYSRWVRFRIR